MSKDIRNIEINMVLNNWVVIYPHKNKDKIKNEFKTLKLKGFGIKVIIINDSLSDDEENIYVDFVNKNLEYGGHIEVSLESDLMNTIEGMGGVDNEDIYLIKNGKIFNKKTKL